MHGAAQATWFRLEMHGIQEICEKKNTQIFLLGNSEAGARTVTAGHCAAVWLMNIQQIMLLHQMQI